MKAKNILLSKTVWGVIITLIGSAGLFQKFGISIGDSEAAADQIVQALGAAWTIYGRIKAKEDITLFPKKDVVVK